MKRTICFLLIAALCMIAGGCGTQKVDIGKETTSVAVQNGNQKEAAHLTDQGYVNKMDHFDKKGNLVYTEIYEYDDEGTVKGYVYRDAKDELIARYDIAKGQFYNKAGLQITEDAFLEKLRALGADV